MSEMSAKQDVTQKDLPGNKQRRLCRLNLFADSFKIHFNVWLPPPMFKNHDVAPTCEIHLQPARINIKANGGLLFRVLLSHVQTLSQRFGIMFEQRQIYYIQDK